jgi:hypothetical protein
MVEKDPKVPDVFEQAFQDVDLGLEKQPQIGEDKRTSLEQKTNLLVAALHSEDTDGGERRYYVHCYVEGQVDTTTLQGQEEYSIKRGDKNVSMADLCARVSRNLAKEIQFQRDPPEGILINENMRVSFRLHNRQSDPRGDVTESLAKNALNDTSYDIDRGKDYF